MYLHALTRYEAPSSGTTISCIMISTVWSSRSSGRPSTSRSYPSSLSRATLVPIHDGRKWVRGELVASNRTVPSLKTVSPQLCRISPFSSGSAARSWLISSLTPLRGVWARTRAFSWAAASIFLSGTDLYEYAVAFLPHEPHSAPSTRVRHEEQVRSSAVFSPHAAHRTPRDSSPHAAHLLFDMLVKKDGSAAALSRSRCGPPFAETGNRQWTGGLMLRAAAFSGRPILTPRAVENFGRISTPDDAVIASGTVGRAPSPEPRSGRFS